MAPDLAEPAARFDSQPLYLHIADSDSIDRFGDQIETPDPSGWPGYAEQIAAARQVTGARHAVTTGLATVAGQRCVLVGFDFEFLGGSVGVAEGARIADAFSVAVVERVPVVTVAATGGSRMQEGTSSLIQMQVMAAAIAGARRAGVPHIAIASDPTTGGIWSSLVASADLLISVPGARVSFSGSRTRPAGAGPAADQYLAEGQWARGLLDVLAPAAELRAIVAAAIRLLSPRSRDGREHRAPVPDWPPAAGGRSGQPRAPASAWAQVQAARSPDRARADRWLDRYFDETVQIRGDRCGGLDSGVRCGFGSHRGGTIGYAAETGTRVTAAGFRTATRLISLADRLGVPVLTLIDTPGAAAAPADEAAGLGPAIAELLVAIAASQVPITSVVIGEGVSGGALALASPDHLWIAEDAYLAVTAPELAAAILKLSDADIPAVAGLLRLTPDDLLTRRIVRGIIRADADSPSC
ncbi:MAG: carboxyl transferase domain-containing protein [Streptosporangiaceae bacterium]